MASRPLPAFLFVAACLLLSGLVMRRQIAAHPRPPAERAVDPRQGSPGYPGYPGQGGFPPSLPPEMTGQPVDKHTWHVLEGPNRESVVAPIQAQLAAFRKNDAQEIMRYQRHGPFRFPPGAFLDRVLDLSPVFAQSRAARFSTVWADPDGQHADVHVSVQGGNGRAAEGLYEMVRQDGQYRVAVFQGGGWVPK